MAPPVEELTKRRTAAARAASRTLTVPATFTPASKAGSATDRRTSIWAARWKTTSGAAEATSSRIAAPSRMSASWKRASSARFERRPVERSSTTVTSSPRASSASTRLEPTKPAPPVTRARMGSLILGCAGVRVWVDFTNTAHVVVLRPLVERLQQEGHDVLLTARPLSHTVELLEQWGVPHAVVGRYGGVSKASKARAAADRTRRLLGVVRRFAPDKALAHGSTDVPLVGRILRIPNTTTFDYEWAAL